MDVRMAIHIPRFNPLTPRNNTIFNTKKIFNKMQSYDFESGDYDLKCIIII